jgi:hypothetical protein
MGPEPLASPFPDTVRVLHFECQKPNFHMGLNQWMGRNQPLVTDELVEFEEQPVTHASRLHETFGTHQFTGM